MPKHIQNKLAQPFVKWAGGKTQMLEQFKSYFPKELISGEIENYYEPFVGGGAVFFHIKQNFKIKNAFLYDINEELILIFKVIQKYPEELIKELSDTAEKYRVLSNEERKSFYYNIREELNEELAGFNFQNFSDSWIHRAVKLLFLNRTCFNGLFRVNNKGEFNVPFGDYKNPKILDSRNLRAVSELLQDVELYALDFTTVLEHIKENSFIYFDPPYRPISKTSSFTSYSKDNFDEDKQKKLAEVFKSLSQKEKLWLMLSNSDPQNENNDDNFFEHHYMGENIYISRVLANRMINSVAEKRGRITELIITNYQS